MNKDKISNKVFKDVHNYTKFKLIEMMIKRYQEARLNLNDLNSIEEMADDVMSVLSICGLKYSQELNGEFGSDEIQE